MNTVRNYHLARFAFNQPEIFGRHAPAELTYDAGYGDGAARAKEVTHWAPVNTAGLILDASASGSYLRGWIAGFNDNSKITKSAKETAAALLTAGPIRSAGIVINDDHAMVAKIKMTHTGFRPSIDYYTDGVIVNRWTDANTHKDITTAIQIILSITWPGEHSRVIAEHLIGSDDAPVDDPIETAFETECPVDGCDKVFAVESGHAPNACEHFIGDDIFEAGPGEARGFFITREGGR